MKKITWLGAFFLGGTLLATTLATPVVADTNAGPGPGPGIETTNLSGNTTVSADQTVFTATADQSANAKSTAQFTVEAGQLTLVAVPDLNFGAAKPATIVNGGSQSLVSVNNNVVNGSSKGKFAFDGNNAGKLIVSDMRGTGEGWSLSASMDSNFAAGDSKLMGLSMNLKATGSNSFLGSDKALDLTVENISNDPKPVFSTKDDNRGVGDTTFNLDLKDTSLNFPRATNSTFKAGTYQSNVTWTLGATPTP